MCLLTCGQENVIKGGTVRDPPSIAPLSWCLPRALISHGLSRPTFKIFCTSQGSAARPYPGRLDRLPGHAPAARGPRWCFLCRSPFPMCSHPRAGSGGCEVSPWQMPYAAGWAQQVFLWPRTSRLPRGSAPRKPVPWPPGHGCCAGRGWCWLTGRSTDRPRSRPR